LRTLARCAFDTKTNRFSIPADFADNHAKAVQFPEPNGNKRRKIGPFRASEDRPEVR
jgi:hypothetical protein